MNWDLSCFAFGLAILSLRLSAEAPSSAEPALERNPFETLAKGSPKERVAARKQLAELGDRARALVDDARESQDAEVAALAKENWPALRSQIGDGVDAKGFLASIDGDELNAEAQAIWEGMPALSRLRLLVLINEAGGTNNLVNSLAWDAACRSAVTAKASAGLSRREIRILSGLPGLGIHFALLEGLKQRDGARVGRALAELPHDPLQRIAADDKLSLFIKQSTEPSCQAFALLTLRSAAPEDFLKAASHLPDGWMDGVAPRQAE